MTVKRPHPGSNRSAPLLAGRYQVLKQMGFKAGRRTLLARDRQTQAFVVVKLLLFGHDFRWETLKLFEREVETLRSLSHPAIPRYLDSFEVNLPGGRGFGLVQTYIPAKSLEAHLIGGRTFSEAEVEELAKAMLDILHYLHNRQPAVIHRDLKPSNILLGNDSIPSEKARSTLSQSTQSTQSTHPTQPSQLGQVYLVDFGSVQTLATQRDRGTMTVVGTYGYMPPEQFGGRTVPASDLYSLGGTLIYLITGRHPSDLPQTDFRIEFERVAQPSLPLTLWLQQMTEPILERRFQSAAQALQALKHQHVDFLPSAARKPFGTAIHLWKDASHLEILVPARGLNGRQVCLKLLPIAGFAIALFCLLLLAETAAKAMLHALLLSAMPLLLPLFTITTTMTTWYVVRSLFDRLEQVRLQVDRQQIFTTHELLGKRFHTSRPALRREIGRLEMVYVDVTTRDLVIWAGVRRYQVSRYGLSDPEAEWLAYELSRWLGLPITRKRLSL